MAATMTLTSTAQGTGHLGTSTASGCQPLLELPRQGKNATYVKGCEELHLGAKGLTQLSGFQSLVNLEVLWVNNNQLQAINNLDHNFRIKKLYAQNNCICTLKGSLAHFKFLDTLDLSNNQLRNLDKLLVTLQKLPFLSYLNLQSNPCCEEPHYRTRLIHGLPSLHILDLHEVTLAERQAAEAAAGVNPTAATIAFGKRVPADDGSWRHKAPVVSALEQDLIQRVTTIHQRQAAEEFATTQRLYSNQADADYYNPKKTLPPPPGWAAAQQQWQHSMSTAGGFSDTVSMAHASTAATTTTGTQPGGGAAAVCKDYLVLYSWQPAAAHLQATEKPWTRTCPPAAPGKVVLQY